MKIAASIRGQLFILALGACSPLAALVAYNLYVQARSESAELHAEASRAAAAIAALAARSVDETHGLLSVLAKRQLIRSAAPGTCDPIFAQFGDLFPRYSALVTRDLDGERMCSSARPAPGSATRIDPGLYLERILRTRAPVHSQAYRGSTTGRWVVSFAHPLLGGNGEVAGTLALAIDLARFGLLPGASTLPFEAVVRMVDGNGVVLASSERPERWVGRDVSASPVFALRHTFRSNGARMPGLDDIERIYGASDVRGTQWVVLVGMPTNQFDVLQTRTYASLVFATLAFVLAGTFAYVIVRRIVKPIEAIASTARRASDPRYSGGPDLVTDLSPEAPQEIRSLAEDFTSMLRNRLGTESALHAAQARLQIAVEAAGVGLWERDLDGVKMRYSDQWRQQLGLESAEVVDTVAWWVRRLHPEDAPRLMAMVEKYLQIQDTELAAEYRMLHKDGDYRWFFSKGMLINDADGRARYLLGGHIDITVRKQAELALKRSERWFRLMADNVPSLVWVTDVSGRWTYVNARWHALTGLPSEDALRSGALDAVHVDDRVRANQSFLAALRERARWACELRVRAHDGTYRLLQVEGVPWHEVGDQFAGYIGSSVDITEREVARQALQSSEQRYRSVIEAMAEGMVLYSAAGFIVSCNPAAESILGRPASQIIGSHYASTPWHPRLESGHQIQPHQHPVHAVLSEGRSVRGLVRLIERSDGTTVWLLLNGEPIFDEGGTKVASAVLSFADITEQKQNELHLRDLAWKLVDVEEVERQHLHRELHDRLGQDLAVINLHLEMLRVETEKAAPPLTARVDRLREGARSAILHTRNLMAELRPEDLDAFGLKAALDAYAKRLDSGFAVTVNVVGDQRGARQAPTVEMAFFRIAQEAINNVIKHARARQVRLTLLHERESMELSVADDGAGFEPGSVASSSYGIRIMRERAQAIGAELRVDSKPGQGSRVTVRLKVVRDESSHSDS